MAAGTTQNANSGCWCAEAHLPRLGVFQPAQGTGAGRRQPYARLRDAVELGASGGVVPADAGWREVGGGGGSSQRLLGNLLPNGYGPRGTAGTAGACQGSARGWFGSKGGP